MGNVPVIDGRQTIQSKEMTMKKMMSMLLLAVLVLSMVPVMSGCGKKKMRVHTEETRSETHTRTVVE